MLWFFFSVCNGQVFYDHVITPLVYVWTFFNSFLHHERPAVLSSSPFKTLKIFFYQSLQDHDGFLFVSYLDIEKRKRENQNLLPTFLIFFLSLLYISLLLLLLIFSGFSWLRLRVCWQRLSIGKTISGRNSGWLMKK
jgi:hypothetical protein